MNYFSRGIEDQAGWTANSSAASQMAERPFTVSTEKNEDKARARESCFLHGAGQEVTDYKWQSPQGVPKQLVNGARVGHQTRHGSAQCLISSFIICAKCLSKF